jgi:hypothetical protein
MARSIIAVLVGFVVIGALAVGADFAMLAIAPGRFTLTGRMDDPAVLLLVLAYVFAFAVFGCWLAARLAPDRPLQHALVLGALGLAFNVVGTIARWDDAPVWYHVIALLLVMPAAWLGGRLRERPLERPLERPPSVPLPG